MSGTAISVPSRCNAGGHRSYSVIVMASQSSSTSTRSSGHGPVNQRIFSARVGDRFAAMPANRAQLTLEILRPGRAVSSLVPIGGQALGCDLTAHTRLRLTSNPRAAQHRVEQPVDELHGLVG